jgi:hypothetical protein
MTFSFIDCWPTSIAAIELNYDTVGDMENFAVTWEYDYYTMTAGSILGQGSEFFGNQG